MKTSSVSIFNTFAVYLRNGMDAFETKLNGKVCQNTVPSGNVVIYGVSSIGHLFYCKCNREVFYMQISDENIQTVIAFITLHHRIALTFYVSQIGERHFFGSVFLFGLIFSN